MFVLFSKINWVNVISICLIDVFNFSVYSWFHLGFNLLVQLCVGLPLEMVHGGGRVACIYFAGVLAGSLGTSVFDPEVFLVGASGGVYALLAAHLSNVMLNYSNMQYGFLRIVGVLSFGKLPFLFYSLSSHYHYIYIVIFSRSEKHLKYNI